MKALLAVLALLALSAHADSRRSGFDFMSPATQAMQRDYAQNPAGLWLKDGERAFAVDCAACHSAKKLRDVATRYPAFDAKRQKPITLGQRINQCRVRHMKTMALTPEGDELLALQSYVASLSRGLPIAPPVDKRLQPFREQGAKLFQQNLGQLNLSCAQCHDTHAGRRLGASLIPQAHPTGYPIYRLEWQGMGSLQRRLRNCMVGVRAEPFAFDSDEFTALELHLMQRASGMAIETPAVRP
jgi:L-cysteine S-thiosulfotransferase